MLINLKAELYSPSHLPPVISPLNDPALPKCTGPLHVKKRLQKTLWAQIVLVTKRKWQPVSLPQGVIHMFWNMILISLVTLCRNYGKTVIKAEINRNVKSVPVDQRLSHLLVLYCFYWQWASHVNQISHQGYISSQSLWSVPFIALIKAAGWRPDWRKVILFLFSGISLFKVIYFCLFSDQATGIIGMRGQRFWTEVEVVGASLTHDSIVVGARGAVHRPARVLV